MKQKTKTKNKKTTLLYLLLPVVLLLAVIQVIFANRVANAGKILEALEKETSQLETENKQLEMEIAKQGSLETLKQKAEELDFTSEIVLVNLSQQKEVAFKY